MLLFRLAYTCVALTALAAAAPAADPPKSGKYHVYIGTYTRAGGSQGIYRIELDAQSGGLSKPELVADLANPSFLALDPGGKFLYAVSETHDAGTTKTEGQLSAYSVDAVTGKLSKLNEVATGGGDPCHVSVNRTGRFALVANYAGGSSAMFRLDESGRIGERVHFRQHAGSGPDKERQAGPHAHCAVFYSLGSEEFASVVDLGLDTVFSYRLDHAKGELVPTRTPEVKLPPGTGPRHIAFSETAGKAFVCGELSSTLHTLRAYDRDGGLQPYDGSAPGIKKRADAVLSTLPKDAPAELRAKNSTAEVLVHPTSGHVLVSNRGHDSLAVFKFNADMTEYDSHITSASAGREFPTPRNFNIDPTGKWLVVASQGGGEVSLAQWDRGSAKIAQAIKIDSPVCVTFLEKKQ